VKKTKKVNFQLIDPKEEPEPYNLLVEVREKTHETIGEAKIALAWRLREKADPDGKLVLGKCIRVSDLYKEFSEFDAIILLNSEVWNDIEFTREKKLALIDHELCHLAPKYDDETGEPVVDERGRQVYRTRKHDLEEFSGIVERHGCWKRDLERFAEVLLRKQKSPLFRDKDETTVSIEFQGKKSEPIPLTEFSERCDQVAKDCDLYGQAVRLVREAGKCSVSLLQRKLSLGYGTAAHIIDQMEERGVVGPAPANAGPREVLPIIGQEPSAAVN